MHVTRNTCCVVFALILTLGFRSVACALTSGPFTTSTPIPYTKTDWTGTLSFPKFDSSLGMLTQVDIFISATLRTTLTVTNTGTSASTGTAKTEVAVTVSDPLSLLSVGPDFYSPNYAFSLNPGESATSGLLTKSGSDTQSFTDASILSEFTGPGTITMNAGTFTLTWLAYNGGNTDASQVTDANCTGTVLYYYEIPEPSGLMFLAPAFLGLVTMIKKRR